MSIEENDCGVGRPWARQYCDTLERVPSAGGGWIRRRDVSGKEAEMRRATAMFDKSMNSSMSLFESMYGYNLTPSGFPASSRVKCSFGTFMLTQPAAMRRARIGSANDCSSCTSRIMRENGTPAEGLVPRR